MIKIEFTLADRIPPQARWLIIVIMLFVLAGCAGGRTLMPVPNVYTGESAKALFRELPEELKGSDLDLLYVTDRIREADSNGQPVYGSGRSHSVAFGSVIVRISPEMDWDDLVHVSQEKDRSVDLKLELVSIRELDRFPSTPPPLILVDGEARMDPAYGNQQRRAEKAFLAEVQRRLRLSPRAEILVFVHGYHNDFDDAAFTLAETWHFMGREFVPILYTWPAGKGGPSGYIYDRESGEFTVHHLKNLIEALSTIEEIESFHMIAHSRGTDVLTSAIRERALVARAMGDEVPEKLKDSHIVLAAPDLDLDVVSQRVVAEQLGRETKNITIYTSQTDKAIGIAETLFDSVKRIGRLDVDDLTARQLESVKYIEGISIVEIQEVAKPDSSHSYFHSDPAASSDLVLTVRYGLEPGGDQGRPLKLLEANFWQIEPGYPYDTAATDR
jgi:esterase/lipase superfamily enzyme